MGENGFADPSPRPPGRRASYAGLVAVIDPSDMLRGEPLPGWAAHFFHSEHMTFAHYRIAEGATPLHEHHHEQEEVWNVVAGEVIISIDGVEHALGAGSVAIVPPHTPHSVRPVGACHAIIVDYPLRTELPGMSRPA
jgi:mannose-6-phosphate isomerase-like protein (cupin superfamily)